MVSVGAIGVVWCFSFSTVWFLCRLSRRMDEAVAWSAGWHFTI